MDGRTHHLYKKSRRDIIIALEDIDFIWSPEEYKQLIEFFHAGKKIDFMADYFEREDPDDVFIGLFDLARKGKIQKIDLRRLI